jgi:hypothetical protein
VIDLPFEKTLWQEEIWYVSKKLKDGQNTEKGRRGQGEAGDLAWAQTIQYLPNTVKNF